MSGEKYKTITESEYNRLRRDALAATTERERAAALERLNARLAESARAAERANNALNARVSTLNAKIDAANKTASDVKKELYDTIKATNKALSDQRTTFERELKKTRSDFADVLDRNNRHIEDVIKKNNDALHKEINSLRTETKTAVKDLNTKISTLAEKVGDPHKVTAMAQDHLDVAKELLAEAEKHRHQLLLPGQYDKVAGEVAKAAKNVLLGTKNPAAASAALISGQDAFAAAKQFYDDLLAAENEWNARLAFALDALASAEARIGANKTVTAWEEEFDVDHWTNGGLKKLQDLTTALRRQLEDPAQVNKLSCKDLEDIASSAQLITDDADHILTGALIALECSDERANLAADLAEELAQKAGLEQIKADGYEGNDQRAANMIHLKNGTTEFEVIITLTPDFSNGQCGWRAETSIVNPGNSAASAAAFDKELKAVMSSHGLSGNCPIPVDSTAAQAVKDWKEREKVHVPAVATPGADTIKVTKH
jgi:hypothetical protein